MSFLLILFHNIDIVLWYYGDIKKQYTKNVSKLKCNKEFELDYSERAVRETEPAFSWSWMESQTGKRILVRNWEISSVAAATICLYLLNTHTDSVSQSRALLPKPVLDIQTLQRRVSSRTGLGSTGLENLGWI